MAVGDKKEKWSVCYSPFPRFEIYTSNNVELINGALKRIRYLPILDCLLELEKYVSVKWCESLSAAQKWNFLTGKAASRVDKALRLATDFHITQYSSTTFLVKVRQAPKAPLEFAVDLNDKSNPCTCGYTKDMVAPCIHVLVSLRSVNRMTEIHSFFHSSWTKETFIQAYNEDAHGHILPPVLKADVKDGNCDAPEFTKKRGRPRKKRIESQAATAELSQAPKKKKKCGICGQIGHNRKTCNRYRLI